MEGLPLTHLSPWLAGPGFESWNSTPFLITFPRRIRTTHLSFSSTFGGGGGGVPSPSPSSPAEIRPCPPPARVAPVCSASNRRSRRQNPKTRTKPAPPLAPPPSLDLELEILRFMEASDKPASFPTRSDLVKAGRSDLVDAVLAQGGWMAAGWKAEARRRSKHPPTTTTTTTGARRLSKCRPPNTTTTATVAATTIIEKSFNDMENRYSSSSLPDSPSKVVEVVLAHGPNGGGEQIVESTMENNSSFRLPLHPREGNGAIELSEPATKIAGTCIISEKETVSNAGGHKSDDQGSSTERRQNWDKVARLFGLKSSQKKPESDGQSSPPEVQKISSDCPSESSIRTPTMMVNLTNLRISAQPETEEAFEQVIEERDKTEKQGQAIVGNPENSMNVALHWISKKVEARQKWMVTARTASRTKKKNEVIQPTYPTTLGGRIGALESKLAATLESLKHGRKALLRNEYNLNEVHEKAVAELERLSDALEFRENAIMNTNAELRTTRAQLVALGGKTAFEMMRVQKTINEKTQELMEAEKVLNCLRVARVVWSYPASEVLLAGSFDGWANPIKMDLSNAGVFVTSLRLLPGKYEIKFIVDGVWRVDTRRPVVYNSGYENNLLIVA